METPHKDERYTRDVGAPAYRHGQRAKCAFCKCFVVYDFNPESGDRVGDWHIVGDFGCDNNPINGDEGTGGHYTAAEVLAVFSAYALGKLVIAPSE